MKNKLFIITAIIILATMTTAFAQNVKNDYSVGAWVEDKELEKDIAIRDKPSGFGKSVGEIPFVMEDKDKVHVSITGYSKGWLRIQFAAKMDETVLFSGDGWIKANRVNAAVISKNGKPVSFYALPQLKSKKVGTLPDKTQFEVIGYDHFGLKIRYKGKTGWLSRDNICGDPLMYLFGELRRNLCEKSTGNYSLQLHFFRLHLYLAELNKLTKLKRLNFPKAKVQQSLAIPSWRMRFTTTLSKSKKVNE